MSADILTIVYGLASAAVWGAGDFSGGLAAKRNRAMTVVLASQVVGGIFILSLARLFGEGVPPPVYWGWGALAGISGALGLLAFYRGLAGSRMGLVAPMSALVTAALPIAVGVVTEGLPSPGQRWGFAVALPAIWLIAQSDGSVRVSLADMRLPVLSGLGFGLFFIFISRVSAEAVFWPLFSARLASVSLFLAVSLSRRQLGAMFRSIRCWPVIIVAGIFDAGGNALFALASRAGRLDIATVSASMYPATTVLLAWIVLKERLGRKQWLGVAGILAALALLAL